MKPGQLLFLLLPVALLLLLFNSQRRRQRQSQDVQSSVTPGSEICTTAGLFGTVVSIDDKIAVIEAAPGVRLRFDRRAIALVVPPDPPPDDDPHPVTDSP